MMNLLRFYTAIGPSYWGDRKVRRTRCLPPPEALSRPVSREPNAARFRFRQTWTEVR